MAAQVFFFCFILFHVGSFTLLYFWHLTCYHICSLTVPTKLPIIYQNKVSWIALAMEKILSIILVNGPHCPCPLDKHQSSFLLWFKSSFGLNLNNFFQPIKQVMCWNPSFYITVTHPRYSDHQFLTFMLSIPGLPIHTNTTYSTPTPHISVSAPFLFSCFDHLDYSDTTWLKKTTLCYPNASHQSLTALLFSFQTIFKDSLRTNFFFQ